MHWVNQTDNQLCPSNLSRMLSFSMFCTGNPILSSASKIGSIKTLHQDTFTGCPTGKCHPFVKEGNISYVSLLHTSSQQQHRVLHNFSYQLLSYRLYWVPSFSQPLPPLYWGFTTFSILCKLASYSNGLLKMQAAFRNQRILKLKILCSWWHVKTRKQ